MANLKIPQNVKVTLNNSKLIIPLTVEDILSYLTEEQKTFIENFTPQINFTVSSTGQTFAIVNYATLLNYIPEQLLEHNFEVGLVVARHHYNKKKRNILTDLYHNDGELIKNAVVLWNGTPLTKSNGTTDYLKFSIDENSHLIVKNKNNIKENLFSLIKPGERKQDEGGRIIHEHYYFGIVFRIIDKKSKIFIKTKYSLDCVDVSLSENPRLRTAEEGAYRFD